jgi:hypothetical protein
MPVSNTAKPATALCGEPVSDAERFAGGLSEHDNKIVEQIQLLPRRAPGRQSAGAEAEYRKQRQAFCQTVLQIRSRLDFEVGSRGWSYIFENRGTITKDDLDLCQKLINDCRKSGELPLDICASDESRKFENLEFIDETSPAEEAVDIVENAISAHRRYNPVSFWDFQDSFIQVLVEKIDLRSLFGQVCEEYAVPIANAKGWSDLNSRADMMERFRYWEEKGKQCVLLYCGDHDPAGLNISNHLRSNLAEMSAATGWDPANLVIERFGLNHEFIVENGLIWIENLITGSGERLDDPRHPDHKKPYVQDYIAKFGVRKVEANALVVAPEAGRALCRAAIERHLDLDRIREYRAWLRDAQAEVASEVRRLLAEAAQ